MAPQKVLVYRPYWLAKVTLDEGARWVLLDGSFETIAGYPDDAEVLKNAAIVAGRSGRATEAAALAAAPGASRLLAVGG